MSDELPATLNERTRIVNDASPTYSKATWKVDVTSPTNTEATWTTDATSPMDANAVATDSNSTRSAPHSISIDSYAIPTRSIDSERSNGMQDSPRRGDDVLIGEDALRFGERRESPTRLFELHQREVATQRIAHELAPAPSQPSTEADELAQQLRVEANGDGAHEQGCSTIAAAAPLQPCPATMRQTAAGGRSPVVAAAAAA